MVEHDRYRYTESGLDNIYLVNGFERLSTPRGESVRVFNEEGLLEAIGCWLVTEKKWLNGKEVRFLRKELGLTQQDLSAILGIDVQAFARWETGRRSRQAASADRLLRVLYIEHVRGNPRIRECLQKLAELDELRDEEMEMRRPLVFAQNDAPGFGWVREPERAYG